MSLIDSKNWHARKNKMPSLEGSTLVITGEVTVANSAVEASLKVSRRQDRSNGLNVDVVLVEKGVGLSVLTEKAVSLTLQGHQDTTLVQIIHDGKVVGSVPQIETVY